MNAVAELAAVGVMLTAAGAMLLLITGPLWPRPRERKQR